MKYLKFLTLIILSTVFLFSCSGNNGNKRSSSDDKQTAESSTTTSTKGNASWSCVIDGQIVSGGQISSYQGPEGFLSHEGHIVDVDQGNELLFYLSDKKKIYTGCTLSSF